MNKINSNEEYRNIVYSILCSEEFNKIKTIEHHGVSRFDHSFRVSYYSYKISKFLKLDYLEMYSEYKRLKEKIKNSFYNIYIRKSDLQLARFGIAVGKKLGNAVARNKIKRRMRNILTNQKKLFSKGYDYIIIMKEKTKLLKYEELNEKLNDLLKKENI